MLYNNKKNFSKTVGSPNLSYLFYREVFPKGMLPEDADDYVNTIKKITTYKLPNNYSKTSVKSGNIAIYKGFSLKTVYPGLLIGIGSPHETGNSDINGTINGKEVTLSDIEFKLGFFLDYTTGLPIIPGSTVKGVLKSAFKKYPDYISGIIKKENLVEKLTNNIFEGKKDDGKTPFSMHERLIFFDAVLSEKNRGKEIMNLEYITPHGDKPYKNPTPLRMLKVRPEIEFDFMFKIPNDKYCGIDREVIVTLFKEIIMTFGIGAKTNVGFGVMKGLQERSSENG